MPWIATALFVAAALLALRLAIGGGAFAQSVGWPTPPPGPSFPVPSAEQVQAEVTGTVARPGSEVALIRPAWPGHVPLIPPIASTRVAFVEGAGSGPPLTVQVDSGTFEGLVQLRVSPVEPDTFPALGATVLWAFELEAFDEQGRRLNEDPKRPLKLTVPTALFTTADIDGLQLLFALVEGDRHTPIVTSFDPAAQLITSRLLRLGTVALVHDSR